MEKCTKCSAHGHGQIGKQLLHCSTASPCALQRVTEANLHGRHTELLSKLLWLHKLMNLRSAERLQNPLHSHRHNQKMEQAQLGTRYPDRQQQAVLGGMPSQRHRQAARCQAAHTCGYTRLESSPGILTESKAVQTPNTVSQQASCGEFSQTGGNYTCVQHTERKNSVQVHLHLHSRTPECLKHWKGWMALPLATPDHL